MMKIGINGFGRIGRALARLISRRDDMELAAVNDLDPDTANHAYLLRHDSIYGGWRGEVAVHDCGLIIDGVEVGFHADANISRPPWQDYGVDVVIDATGTSDNVLRAREICPEKVRKVVITHSPDSGVDATLIQGANEGSYVKDHHHVISASICDAVAVAPILNELDKFCGLNNCFFTTLHPCLSYQNVLDGTLRSVSSPGNYWRDYGLGRSMIGNLIPKETTAAKATLKVLPQLRGRVAAMSYRIPTQIVTSSDITAVTNRKVVATEINELFSGLAVTNPQVFGVSNDHMVSLDYLGTEKSVFIDTRWTMVAGDNMLKLVVWYDNEHGYSSKVLDLVEMVISGALPHE